jgi:hypothetical protein
MESGELQTLGIDVVLITGHLTDASRGANYLFRLLSSGQDVPYDTVKALMNAAGWNAPPTEAEARRTMRNYEAELSRVTFARMGELCRQNGWRCVYAYTPMPFEHTNQSLLLSYASAGGLETLDLGDVYDRYDERKLVITEWDYHPNIKGHHIIADRLQKELVKKSGVLTHQARPVVSDGQTQHNRRQP